MNEGNPNQKKKTTTTKMAPEDQPDQQADIRILEHNHPPMVSAKRVRGEPEEAIPQVPKESQYERITKTVVRDVSSDHAHARINKALRGTVDRLKSRSHDVNKERDDLRKDLEKMRQERNTAMEALNDQNEKTTTTFLGLEGLISALEEENERLKAGNWDGASEMKDLRQQLAHRDSCLSESASANAALRQELTEVKALREFYNAMIEFRPEISALLDEVRFRLTSEEWGALGRDGFKAQMDLLRSELARYGEIQILRDANASLTSARDAVQTDLDSLRQMHKETTEGNSRTIASLRSEVAELKATSKKRNLHDEEATLVASLREHTHRLRKESDDQRATLNAKIAELKNNLSSVRGDAAQLRTVNSSLEDSIDKEKWATESVRLTNQKLVKELATAQADRDQANASYKQQSDSLRNQASQIRALQEVVGQKETGAVRFVNSERSLHDQTSQLPEDKRSLKGSLTELRQVIEGLKIPAHEDIEMEEVETPVKTVEVPAEQASQPFTPASTPSCGALRQRHQPISRRSALQYVADEAAIVGTLQAPSRTASARHAPQNNPGSQFCRRSRSKDRSKSLKGQHDADDEGDGGRQDRSNAMDAPRSKPVPTDDGMDGSDGRRSIGWMYGSRDHSHPRERGRSRERSRCRERSRNMQSRDRNHYRDYRESTFWEERIYGRDRSHDRERNHDRRDHNHDHRDHKRDDRHLNDDQGDRKHNRDRNDSYRLRRHDLGDRSHDHGYGSRSREVHRDRRDRGRSRDGYHDRRDRSRSRIAHRARRDRSRSRDRSRGGNRSRRTRSSSGSVADRSPHTEGEDVDDRRKRKTKPKSPYRRVYLALVREEVIKPALEIVHYLDIIEKETVDPLTLSRFEQTGENGPDIRRLQLDFKNGLNSPWMTKTVVLLATEARTKAERYPQKYPRNRSQRWFESLVHNVLRQLVDIWKSVEPRAKDGEDGIVETQEEAYERAEKEHGTISKEKRANSRLTTKLTTRKGSVAALILLLRERSDPNVEVWQRIYHILNWMGKDGMSSEESGDEDGRHLMRVRHFEWRRKDATDMMQLLDSIQTLRPNLFNSSGAKPVTRVRVQEQSKRPPPKLYPKSFYDTVWYDSLSYGERMDVRVYREMVEWPVPLPVVH